MPAVAFDERHQDAVEEIADDTDRDHHRSEVVVRKRLACIFDGVAQAGRHAEIFGRDEHDPRNPQREADAGQHVERDRRHDHLGQDVQGLGAKIARHLEPVRVDLGQPGCSCEHHRPDRCDRDQEDDRPVPRCEHQHRKRHPGERTDHPHELERRVGEVAEPLDAPHEDADRHANGDGDQKTGAQAEAAGSQRILDLARPPQLGERLERRKQSELDEGLRRRVIGDKVPSDQPEDGQDRNAARGPGKTLHRLMLHQAAKAALPGGCDCIIHSSITSVRTKGSPFCGTLGSAFHVGLALSAFLT